MIRRWLQCLPSLCIGLLFLAGCQQDTPSEPLGRGLEGAAPRCRGDSSVGALNAAKSLFPDDERQRLVVDICQNIMDARIDADLGADQLHVLAYDGWKAENLSSTDPADLAAFNAAVRGLSPVTLLDSDEQPVWNLTNIGGDQFLAVGPTTASDVHCFGEVNTVDRWCFQVAAAGDSYFFLAEAKPDVSAGDLGACPGPLASDCERDVVHIDVNPDEAVDEDDPETTEVDEDDPGTFVNVWSCTDFATRHARFGVGEDGFGDPGPGVPAGLGNCGESTSALSGMQRWAWAGLKPLRWVAGVGALNAGGTGTTFARGSDVAEGEEGSIRVRDVVCRTTARFASISDGAECRLFLNSSLDPIPGGIGTTDTACTTVGVGKKTGECTWQDIPVPDDICYHAVVDKQSQTGTAHHAEGSVCVGPGDPAREGEKRTCTFNLTTGAVSCVTSTP